VDGKKDHLKSHTEKNSVCSCGKKLFFSKAERLEIVMLKDNIFKVRLTLH